MSEFWAASDIWRDPLIASVIAGGLCGFLGVFVVLRRTVFVSAALTQLSTLGLVLALLLEEATHIETEHAAEQLAVSLLFSVIGALALSALRSGKRLPTESAVGVTYVLAGALVILAASRLVHEAHDLNSMIFGNAVAVPTGDVIALGVIAAICAAVHYAFSKELIFVSFDRETADAMGMRSRRWNGLLFLTIGLAIPVSARALGALPVFALLTVPATAALLYVQNLRFAFALAAAIGVVSATGGYVISWVSGELPTGATMVALAAVFLLPAILFGRRPSA